ncbi:MAG: MSMEG_4193 family putative phosphomutase [Actinomycetales bacterium]|nr:MSMEG_4193 family putative phosphomutase [Actinomycetales bacterium]
MGTVLLIRHGQSVANAGGVLAGRLPGVDLDEVGQSSAKGLGEIFQQLPIAAVVSSPLERTVQTAELLFGQGQQIHLEDQLIECDYGAWQGRLLSELATEPLWSAVQNEPETVTFPEGESMLQMAARASKSIRDWDAKITAEHGETAVWAAISHGDVIKAICADALDLPLRNFQRIAVEPLSISAVQYGPDFTRVHKLNDTGLQWLDNLIKINKSDQTVGGEVTT